MDSTTVVITLAANLTCSGALYYLIGRNLPPRSGLMLWGASALTFGLAYAVRLVEGLWASSWMAAPFDVAMVASALLFAGGMRQFTGRPAGGQTQFALCVVAYVGALGLIFPVWDQQGRYVLLNGVLGVIWSAVAVTAARAAARSREFGLRTPLAFASVLIGLLGLATMLRAATIVVAGVGSMRTGLQAQIYYGYASLATMLLATTMVWMVFVRLHGRMVELATHDALTGVLNRNGMSDALARHFKARSAPPLTLLQLDVDHFKRINDRHGHACGDAVLREIGRLLVAHLRATDFVARVGGEEFVIGCRDVNLGVASMLAERLRGAVWGMRLPEPHAGSGVRCTVSIGISRHFVRREDCDAAWREADAALYAAKSAGRNRVMAFDAAAAA